MAYRNDQYYNLEVAGERADVLSNRSGYYIASDSYTRGEINKKFVYPDRNVREISKYNPNTSVLLNRGYIRSLNDMVSPNAKSVKCQFQFNPKDIQHAVAQSQQIRNFLLQSPNDMAQPIPGSSQFSFDLFFDRTHEFNNPSPNDPLNTEFAWEASDPSQVGVLHDIGILYSVIGVGLSRATQTFARDVYTQQLTYQNQQAAAAEAGLNTTSSQDEEDEEVDVITTDVAGQDATTFSNLETLLSTNVGNAAFLLPFPVRTVFSSLYIVEGFVTSVSVVFTKFSRTMVPVQCAVNLQVDAKYVGFAREQTFLSQSLAGQFEQIVAEQYEAPREVASNANHDFHKVVLALTNWKVQDDNPQENNPAPEGGLGVMALQDFSVTSSNYRYLHMFVKDVPSVTETDEDGETKRYVGGMTQRSFDKGENVSIAFDGSVSLYAYSPDAYEYLSEAVSSRHGNSRSEVLVDYLKDGNGTSAAIGGRWTDPVSSETFSHIHKIFEIPTMDGGLTTTVSTSEQWEKVWKTHEVVSYGSRQTYINNLPQTARDAIHTYYWWAYEFTGKITYVQEGRTVTSEVRKCWVQQYDGQGPGTKHRVPTLPVQDIFTTISIDFAADLPPVPQAPWGAEYGSTEDWSQGYGAFEG